MGVQAIITNNLIVTTVAPTDAYGVFVDASTGAGVKILHNTVDFLTFNPSTSSVGIHYVNTPPDVILHNAFNINGGPPQRFGIDTPGITAATNDYSCGSAPA